MKKALRWGWLPVVVAFAYSSWVLYDRAEGNRKIEAEYERTRARQNEKIVKEFGDGKLKILAFYANPAMISAGRSGTLCYGVVNAKSVRMEPEVADVGPALSRCVETRPTQTTKYTLIATDEQGTEERSEATILVQ